MPKSNVTLNNIVGIIVEIVFFSFFIAFLFGLAYVIYLLIG